MKTTLNDGSLAIAGDEMVVDPFELPIGALIHISNDNLRYLRRCGVMKIGSLFKRKQGQKYEFLSWILKLFSDEDLAKVKKELNKLSIEVQ